MLRQLIATSRASTSPFAAFLSVLGFAYIARVEVALAAWTALAFAGLSASIMTWNDYLDRNHDRRKGKNFASDHPRAVFRYWLGLNALTAIALLATFALNSAVGVFCTAVWALGLLYSLVPRWLIVNNLLVGLCAGAPVLVGMVGYQRFDVRPLLVFATLVFVCFEWEMLKDIEDAPIDAPYKRTIALVTGTRLAVPISAAVSIAWMLCLVAYPRIEMQVVASMGAASGYNAWLLRSNPQRTLAGKRILEWVVRLASMAATFELAVLHQAGDTAVVVHDDSAR